MTRSSGSNKCPDCENLKSAIRTQLEAFEVLSSLSPNLSWTILKKNIEGLIGKEEEDNTSDPQNGGGGFPMVAEASSSSSILDRPSTTMNMDIPFEQICDNSAAAAAADTMIMSDQERAEEEEVEKKVFMENSMDHTLPIQSSNQREQQQQVLQPIGRNKRTRGILKEGWEGQCRALLDNLWSRDDSWPFRHPVDINNLSGYSQLIDTPMCLSLVQSNLYRGEYEEPKEFHRDMMLIFHNAKIFNTDANSSIRRLTQTLQNYYESHGLLQELLRGPITGRRGGGSAGVGGGSTSSSSRPPPSKKSKKSIPKMSIQKIVQKVVTQVTQKDDDFQEKKLTNSHRKKGRKRLALKRKKVQSKMAHPVNVHASPDPQDNHEDIDSNLEGQHLEQGNPMENEQVDKKPSLMTLNDLAAKIEMEDYYRQTHKRGRPPVYLAASPAQSVDDSEHSLTTAKLKAADEHIRPEIMDGRTLHRCVLCSRLLTLRTNARLHVRRVHFNDRMTCPRCQRKFYDSNLLSIHFVTCLGEAEGAGGTVKKDIMDAKKTLRNLMETHYWQVPQKSAEEKLKIKLEKENQRKKLMEQRRKERVKVQAAKSKQKQKTRKFCFNNKKRGGGGKRKLSQIKVRTLPAASANKNKRKKQLKCNNVDDDDLSSIIVQNPFPNFNLKRATGVKVCLTRLRLPLRESTKSKLIKKFCDTKILQKDSTNSKILPPKIVDRPSSPPNSTEEEEEEPTFKTEVVTANQNDEEDDDMMMTETDNEKQLPFESVAVPSLVQEDGEENFKISLNLDCHDDSSEPPSPIKLSKMDHAHEDEKEGDNEEPEMKKASDRSQNISTPLSSSSSAKLPPGVFRRIPIVFQMNGSKPKIAVSAKKQVIVTDTVPQETEQDDEDDQVDQPGDDDVEDANVEDGDDDQMDQNDDDDDAQMDQIDEDDDDDQVDENEDEDHQKNQNDEDHQVDQMDDKQTDQNDDDDDVNKELDPGQGESAVSEVSHESSSSEAEEFLSKRIKKSPASRLKGKKQGPRTSKPPKCRVTVKEAMTQFWIVTTTENDGNDPPTTRVTYECKLCSKLIQWKYSLARHLVIMHVRACEDCGSKFFDKEKFQEHMAVCGAAGADDGHDAANDGLSSSSIAT